MKRALSTLTPHMVAGYCNRRLAPVFAPDAVLILQRCILDFLDRKEYPPYLSGSLDVVTRGSHRHAILGRMVSGDHSEQYRRACAPRYCYRPSPVAGWSADRNLQRGCAGYGCGFGPDNQQMVSAWAQVRHVEAVRSASGKSQAGHPSGIRSRGAEDDGRDAAADSRGDRLPSTGRSSGRVRQGRQVNRVSGGLASTDGMIGRVRRHAVDGQKQLARTRLIATLMWPEVPSAVATAPRILQKTKPGRVARDRQRERDHRIAMAGPYFFSAWRLFSEMRPTRSSSII